MISFLLSTRVVRILQAKIYFLHGECNESFLQLLFKLFAGLILSQYFFLKRSLVFFLDDLNTALQCYCSVIPIYYFTFAWVPAVLNRKSNNHTKTLSCLRIQLHFAIV